MTGVLLVKMNAYHAARVLALAESISDQPGRSVDEQDTALCLVSAIGNALADSAKEQLQVLRAPAEPAPKKKSAAGRPRGSRNKVKPAADAPPADARQTEIPGSAPAQNGGAAK